MLNRFLFACISVAVVLPAAALRAQIRTAVDTQTLDLPDVGDCTLQILSPSLLEVTQITTKEKDTAWIQLKNLFGGRAGLAPPATPVFSTTVGGHPVKVVAMGMKRRVLHAPLARRDLRVATQCYLRLAVPIVAAETAAMVEVRVPNPANLKSPRRVTALFDPRRTSPVIHVNQEGYGPSLPKRAMIGYHQRCGTTNELPFTRFTHEACHTAAAHVPAPQSSAAFAFTWATVGRTAVEASPDNPPQTAPRLTREANQLYPFVARGAVDVSGGHHDAGDYSKYTTNSTGLIHNLVFAVDSIPGVVAMDNLGLPEIGDGISDVLQEAKWEADYLAKLQDTDGGFYFLVYPRTREYESNVLPDRGDAQVVWPKNTAVTAAAVAALAQCASSPQFKRHYPAAAAQYLRQAQLGWQFLADAIAQHGKAGAYQKITFYGDHYTHDDELAWAACELFLATGDTRYAQKLSAWFPNPADYATFRWGWWRMSEGWGNAIRSYAFAARTGRLQAGQLDAAYLAKCEAQIVAAGDDALRWSNQNSYATSFPEETKHVLSAGWYFSLDQAADMATAYQIVAKPAYLDALVGNMNYEGGTNPVNVSYLTGLGQKRQREIVSQYALNDRRVLPPDGIPIGNIQTTFDFLTPYGTELRELVFPSDGAVVAPYEFYDRWADSFNVTTEYIGVNQARSLLALTVLATRTTTQAQAWQSGVAQITAPTSVALLNAPVTLTVQAPGFDLTGARINPISRPASTGTGLPVPPRRSTSASVTKCSRGCISIRSTRPPK